MTATRPVVVDASVALGVLRDEAAGVRAQTSLRDWASIDRPILVPSHFWLEIVNVVGRSGRASGERVLAAVHRLDGFGLQTVEPDRPLLLQVIDRVERLGLSSYDAMYLVLAESVDADLATFDRELAAAAGTRAIAFETGGLHESPVMYEHDVSWPSYKGASAYLAKLRAEALAERA